MSASMRLVEPIPAPEPVAVWIVHSAKGVTALAWPIGSGADPVAPESAPDPQEGDHQ